MDERSAKFDAPRWLDHANRMLFCVALTAKCLSMRSTLLILWLLILIGTILLARTSSISDTNNTKRMLMALCIFKKVNFKILLDCLLSDLEDQKTRGRFLASWDSQAFWVLNDDG